MWAAPDAQDGVIPRPRSPVRARGSSLGTSPSPPPTPLPRPGIAEAHHKDAPGCSTQVAWGLGGTGCLIIVGLLAGVEGVVVERQHQVGIHLTEEPARLAVGEGTTVTGLAVPRPQRAGPQSTLPPPFLTLT